MAKSTALVFDGTVFGLRPDRWNGELEGVSSGAGISLIFNYLHANAGARLHKHPYAETFIVRSGVVQLTAGEHEIMGTAGQIIVVPANTPHKFVQHGPEPLEMLDIHASPQFITIWLDSVAPSLA